MSLFDYRQSRELSAKDASFAALIMAAIRKADSFNALALSETFPEIAEELQARYDAPGGVLPGETAPEELHIHAPMGEPEEAE